MSAGIKVCVVEDDAAAADVLCEGLKKTGYNPRAFYTGEDALKACDENKFDLILLDVMLPDVDGYEVCRLLKANPDTQDIPVVFVTGKDAPEEMSRGLELGAADYITKPYNLPMVMLRLDSVLQRNGNGQQHEEALISDPAYTDELTGLRNRRYLRERLQEEVDKAHRYDVPLSCVVIDVEEIQALDEEAGPVPLEDLLPELAFSLRSLTRTHDILARFDSNMFAAVLPHTSLENAMHYVNNILEEVEASTFSDVQHPSKAKLRVGVVTCRNGSAKSADQVLGDAMRSLLQAKSSLNGRVKGRAF